MRKGDRRLTFAVHRSRTIERSLRPLPRKQFLARDLWHSRPTLCFAAVSALCIVVCYGPVFSAPFVYDDVIAIQQNPALSSWHSVLLYFHTPVPLSNEFRGYGGLIYRPLMWLSYIVDRHLWGLHPAGFHATNLILYWISGLTGFALLRALRVSTTISALVCLVWLGLPINSEAWISGRSTLQVSLFIFLSLLVAIRYLASRKPLQLVAYGTTSLAALLSNEWGVVTLPLTLLALGVDGYKPRKIWLPICSVGLVAMAVCAGLRSAAGARLPIGSLAVLPVGLSFLKYVSWILLPIRMSVERPSDGRLTPCPLNPCARLLCCCCSA